MSSLYISILGELLVHVDGTTVPITSRKQRELLAMLGVRRGEPRSIDGLVADLWGDARSASSRKNLHVLVGQLRATLGSGAIQLEGSGYALSSAAWSFADVEFERDLSDVRGLAAREEWTAVDARLGSALDRWRGAAFGTFADAEWAREPARLLDADRRAATILRIEAWLRTGRQDQAVVELRELTREQDEDLELSALFVRALYDAGRQADALDECRAALTRARTHGVESDIERFRSLEHDVLVRANEFGPRRGHALPQVPVPPHELVGRAGEHAAVRDRLLHGNRLTTIVGPGGVGKTRLAADVCLGLADVMEDVAWIELSPASSTDDVLTILLNAFGITAVDGAPDDALAQAIGTRSMCVVLDNFEQVLDSAPVVALIRDRCPNVCLLVTSRIALDVDGEYVMQLGPFELLDEDRDLEALEQLDAVRLFRARAELVGGVMPDNADTLRDVHGICSRVDGLPLGIELAAARTKLLAPNDILQQLAGATTIIATTSAAYAERHRSLDSVIAWSYELLDKSEQHAFRILTLFPGGCTAPDFAHVAGLSDVDVARAALERLTSHSLLVFEQSDRADERWRMLETIAAFGRRELAGTADEPVCRSRFVMRMLEHARASNTYLAHTTGADWRFVDERVNVHAAFEWSMEHSTDVAADIFIAMDRYLETRGSIFDGDDLGRRLQSIEESLDHRRRAAVLGLAGRMAHLRSDADRSSAYLHTALSLAREQKDVETELRVACWYIELQRKNGDVDYETVLERAVSVRSRAQSRGDYWTAALALAQLGFMLMEHDRGQEAIRACTEAKAAFAELDDEFWVENMEANILVLEAVETRDRARLEDLAACAGRLAERGYWAYSAHVESFRLRTLLELRDFAEAASCADGLVSRVRATGESILLMFMLSCASIAYFEQERVEDCRQTAWESLLLATKSEWTFFADYSLVMLVCSLRRDQPALAGWIASSVDVAGFHDYALDRHVASRLLEELDGDDAGHSTSEFAKLPVLERLTRVVERLEAADLIRS